MDGWMDGITSRHLTCVLFGVSTHSSGLTAVQKDKMEKESCPLFEHMGQLKLEYVVKLNNQVTYQLSSKSKLLLIIGSQPR